MSREIRKGLIEGIEKKRGSKVIAYITSDRQQLQHNVSEDVVSVIHRHILSLNCGASDSLDLFLYSRGGDADVPWMIVSMIREYCEDGAFGVLIPYRAHSAATMIALGADEIVMTSKAELSPIDATLQGPYNPEHTQTKQKLPVSVESVRGYFTLLETFEPEESFDKLKADDKLKAFELISRRVHPLALGEVSRRLEQTKLVAERLLQAGRGEKGDTDAKTIAKRLSTDIYSHRHIIGRTEAVRQIGLKCITRAEDAEIADELWELFESYRDFFDLEHPFDPNAPLIKGSSDQHVWEGLPMACVESTKGLDTFRKDVKVQRLPEIPPQVNLNLHNLVFPTVNVGSLPPGSTPQDVEKVIERLLPSLVRGVINDAAARAAAELIKALPMKNVVRTDYNGRWESEGE